MQIEVPRFEMKWVGEKAGCNKGLLLLGLQILLRGRELHCSVAMVEDGVLSNHFTVVLPLATRYVYMLSSCDGI